MKKEFNLNEKRIIYSNASGRGLVRYEEKDVKEFIKKLKVDFYKGLMSKTEVWNCTKDELCDVLEERMHELIDKLAGNSLSDNQQLNERERKNG